MKLEKFNNSYFMINGNLCQMGKELSNEDEDMKEEEIMEKVLHKGDEGII
ncbi:hypothetical protein [Oceanobacillus limi]|nr:hypothetical protein [Oceanobacillus limi]